VAYVGTQISVIALCFIVGLIIKRRNDQTELKYIEPAKPFTSEPEKLIVTSFCKYDLEKLQEFEKQILVGIGLMAVLHLYFNFTQPLWVQTILPMKNALTNNIVRIHLLGTKAEGDLQRPFKNASPFGSLASQPITDKAAIKKAEKAVKTAKKNK